MQQEPDTADAHTSPSQKRRRVESTLTAQKRSRHDHNDQELRPGLDKELRPGLDKELQEIRKKLGPFDELRLALIPTDPYDTVFRPSGPKKQTVLMLAAIHGNLELVLLLLTAGAPSDLRDKDSRTAFDLAVKNGHLQIAQRLFTWGKATLKDGEGALLVALRKGHLEIVRWLVATITAADEYWTTVCFVAVSKGHLLIVKLLLSIGRVSIEKKHEGESLLSCAMRTKQLSVAHWLLDTGGALLDTNKNNTSIWDVINSYSLGDTINSNEFRVFVRCLLLHEGPPENFIITLLSALDKGMVKMSKRIRDKLPGFLGDRRQALDEAIDGFLPEQLGNIVSAYLRPDSESLYETLGLDSNTRSRSHLV